MIIEEVKIEIELFSGERYGRQVEFYNKRKENSNVHLIFGENELGKTTLFKCIVYAFAGEEIYGKNNILPYILSGVDGKEAKTSTIYLQINNGNDRVVIERDALDMTCPIIVYYDCNISEILKCKSKKYFKVKKDRGIEGNELYQDFLFQFFSIPQITDEEIGVQIYFQNIMPMFVIPQNAWTDIQANNPFYGVHNVRQRAFELILGLDTSCDNFAYNLKHKSLQLRKKEKERQLEKLIEVMKLYLTNTVVENENMISSLNLQLEEYHQKIKDMEKMKGISSEQTKPYRDKYKNLKKIQERYYEQVDLIKREISEYDYYLSNLESEIVKLDKLKTAKRLISVIPIQECPHCLNGITVDEKLEIESNYCSLCGSELNNIGKANNNDMYQYLKDEKKDFIKIKENKEKQLKEIENKLYIIALDMKELQDYMNNIDLDLKPDFLREYSYYFNEIGRIKNVLTTLQKEKITIIDKDSLEKDIKELEEQLKGLRTVTNSKEAEENQKKFKFFETSFKKILKSLDFLKDGFNGNDANEANKKIFSDIYIDDESYLPKIKGKNLYNITSSSGLIRIIISYYLAVLSTSIEYKKSVNHPQILLLDEPRQHNLDESTYNKFTNYLLNLTQKTGVQIIITSGNKGTIPKENIALNLNDEGMLIQALNE